VIRLKKWMLVGLAVVILAGLAGIAAAAPDNAPAGPGFRAMGPRGAGMMGCGMGGPMGIGGGLGVSKMIKDLGLTDDQIARMRAIQAEASTRTGSLQASMWQKMSELRDLNWTREPDKDAIKAKQNEINELRKQMAEIQKQMLVDMQNVLTQEQKDKMGNLREAARRDFGGRGMRMKRYPGGNKAPSADSEGASTNSRIS
jgi:Spy/CpxP family protein refolding chaperone